MNIGIFETEHFEAAYPLIRLSDDGQNRITVFSYPAAQRQLDYMLKDDAGRHHWVIKKEDQSRRSFIYTIYKEVKKEKIALLYLNTISDNFLFYAIMAVFLPKTRIILTVHTINGFFETRQKYKLHKLVTAIGKKLLRLVVHEYNVLSQAMMPVLRQRLGRNKRIYNIPGGIFEQTAYPPRLTLQDPVHIVIPGSIDSRRRDYEKAFELLALLKRERIAAKMTFAGRFCGEYGRMIQAKSRQWDNLSYYEDKEVDQPEFERVLQSADFVFTPSVVDTIMDGVKETYGITISSGSISDVVRYAKPFIIPQSLTVDPPIGQSCIRYATVEDIVSFIRSALENPEEYKKLAETALKASSEYTVEKLRERI
jgi:glycosyltransferase involved in cell wall biosynthesis